MMEVIVTLFLTPVILLIVLTIITGIAYAVDSAIGVLRDLD